MDAGYHPSSRSPACSGWMHLLYFAVLLAVVVYAALLVVWPSPAAYCVAERVVRLRAASGNAQLPALSADELALLCETTHGGPVRIETQPTDGGIRICLIATASTPRKALELLEASANQFLQRAPVYVAARTSDHHELQSDEHEEVCWTALEQQLDKLVQCAESLRTDERLTDADPIEAGETFPVSTGIDQSASNLNPEWIKVNEALEAERGRLEELLKTRTSQHPEVQAARYNIEHLAGRLDQIPLLAPPTTENSADASATQADHEVNTSLADMLTNLRQEIGKLDLAKVELKSAFDNYATARIAARGRSTPTPLSLWFAETSGPASFIQRAQGKGPAKHPEILILAISCAVALTWCIRPRVRVRRVLDSTSEARNWGAHVVAIFGDVPANNATTTDEWTPRIAQVAQWGVLVLLAMWLILAASDPMFISNLWHDPAMAIRDAWQGWLLR